jgi:WYL_2, Sm-like SH3 beta-barrel fold
MKFSSQLNSLAWGAIKANRAESWKEAIAIAIRSLKAVELLETEPDVTFAYIKADGTVRIARGTRRADVVAAKIGKPLGDINHAVKAVTYFDFDANAVRSFVPARIAA